MGHSSLALYDDTDIMVLRLVMLALVINRNLAMHFDIDPCVEIEILEFGIGLAGMIEIAQGIFSAPPLVFVAMVDPQHMRSILFGRRALERTDIFPFTDIPPGKQALAMNTGFFYVYSVF